MINSNVVKAYLKTETDSKIRALCAFKKSDPLYWTAKTEEAEKEGFLRSIPVGSGRLELTKSAVSTIQSNLVDFDKIAQTIINIINIRYASSDYEYTHNKAHRFMNVGDVRIIYQVESQNGGSVFAILLIGINADDSSQSEDDSS